MLETFEIRIDEVYRMINDGGLKEGNGKFWGYHFLEEKVNKDGYAYVLVGRYQYFNDDTKRSYTHAHIVDICDDEMDAAHWNAYYDSEELDTDECGNGCWCRELWRVRDLTGSELEDEYGYNEQVAEEMDYEDALETVICGDIFLENGQYSRAYLDALEYITKYDPKRFRQKTLRDLEELRNACLAF